MPRIPAASVRTFSEFEKPRRTQVNAGAAPQRPRAKDAFEEPRRYAVRLPSIQVPARVELGPDAAALEIPDLSQLRLPPWLKAILGTDRDELEQFRRGTRTFRALVQTLRTTPPGDPRHVRAEAKLRERHGYDARSLPGPGQLWVSPRLSAEWLVDGQVTSGRWPTREAISRPPAAIDAPFAYGKAPVLLDTEGNEVEVQDATQLRALIARNRAAAGIANPDGTPAGGEPKGVHVTMEGGGGLGKRYAPVLAEMYGLGIIPTSVSGTSVGAIAAGYLAAGASPKQFAELATDPATGKFFDLTVGGSGLAEGRFKYEYIDRKLRELTGIKDRPVTFADLALPCKIPAAVLSDSHPTRDLTRPENRLFVFSQETTPHTPVVYAMLASGAFPGVLPTVDLVDPTTGRTLILTDSGVFDGLPMDLNPEGLQEVGLSLQEPGGNHPLDHTQVERPLPAGEIDSSDPLAHAGGAQRALADSATATKDFFDRTAPDADEFMFAIPIFDLEDGRKQNKSLHFPYDPALDPRLDAQGKALARSYFARIFHDIGKPGARATNLVTEVPEDLRFERRIELDGVAYQARYAGGDRISFGREGGEVVEVPLGRRAIEALYLDELAFGSLDGTLKRVLAEHFDPLEKLLRELPFEVPGWLRDLLAGGAEPRRAAA